jgi:exonuclease 3'-5' domain-containing protein 1
MAVTKIVFDGHMDYSKLYHERHVTIRGVLDLQLVDVASHCQCGEDEDDQHRRLSPYLHCREIAGQPNSYSKVHKLCGLEQCLKEYKVISDESQEYKSASNIFSTEK